MSTIKRPFIIAEIAQAHDGSLGIAHSYIDALSKCGVNAIKFQTHIAQAESSEFEEFRVPFSFEDKTRFDYWKRMEFTKDEWLGLKAHCEENGVEFISSPFSVAAVDLLEEIDVKRYKVGSGEISNYLMLKRIGQTRKPIILSSGMSNWNEISQTIEFLKPYGNDLAILQCTTAYPTTPDQWGLNMIHDISSRFSIPTGYSDHSGDIHACVAATALGAEFIEFHAVFDKKMFGPDSIASIELSQIPAMVRGIRQVAESLNAPFDKANVEQYQTLRTMFGKTLAVNKNLAKGSILEFGDLESKKPGNRGIAAKDFERVVGKKLANDKEKNSFLLDDDLLD